MPKRYIVSAKRTTEYKPMNFIADNDEQAIQAYRQDLKRGHVRIEAEGDFVIEVKEVV